MDAEAATISAEIVKVVMSARIIMQNCTMLRQSAGSMFFGIFIFGSDAKLADAIAKGFKDAGKGDLVFRRPLPTGLPGQKTCEEWYLPRQLSPPDANIFVGLKVPEKYPFDPSVDLP
jgi:hypothetical protein